jgi:hypothetical protein
MYQHFDDVESAKSQAFRYGQGCQLILAGNPAGTGATAAAVRNCDDDQTKYQNMLMRSDMRNIAIFAFLPVVLAWTLGYGILLGVLLFIQRLVQ